MYGTTEEPWFRGKDVAIILGYKKAKNAIEVHVDSDDKMNLKEIIIGALNQGPDSLTPNELNSIYINESGLYSLILRSKLSTAKQFKRWVTSEVLPSIRKHGVYQLQQQFEDKELTAT